MHIGLPTLLVTVFSVCLHKYTPIENIEETATKGGFLINILETIMNSHEAQQLLNGANVVTDPGDPRTPQEIALFLGLTVLREPDSSTQIQPSTDALTEDKL